MIDGFFSVRTADILVRVKAKPGARSDGVLGMRAGELLVNVHAAPEKGKANEALIRILAETLGVRRSDIALKTGAGSSHKQFTVPLSARKALLGFYREGKA